MFKVWSVIYIRIKFKFGIIFVILLVFMFFINILSNKFLYGDFENLNSVDKEMLSQISEIYGVYSENADEIWNKDYNFKNIPLVLTPVKKDRGIWHRYSYVIATEELSDSIFSKKIKIPNQYEIGNVYRVSALNPKLFSAWFPVNFTFKDIGNSHSMFMKYTKEGIEKTDNIRIFKYFLMHEAFHEYYQVQNWKNVNELSSMIFVQTRDIEQYQIFMTECGILSRINKEENPKKIKELLLDFIAFREYRYSKWNDMKEEVKVETLEGTATYVEEIYKKFELDSDKNSIKLVDFETLFEKTFLQNLINQGNIKGIIDKDIYYYTGFSLGFAMDKLNIDWKSKVDRNEMVYDILKSEIDFKENTDLEMLKKKYDFEKYRESAELLVKSL